MSEKVEVEICKNCKKLLVEHPEHEDRKFYRYNVTFCNSRDFMWYEPMNNFELLKYYAWRKL